MMAYESLSAAYDGLMTDIDYDIILIFLEEILQAAGKHPETVVDLACGTGSMSLLLARKGYHTVGADISEEMLTVAAQKAAELEPGVNPPYFICQPMQKLRLPQPVDAVFCLLDSLNYLTDPEDCKKTFRRVYAALKPGGSFLFDINTSAKLRGLDGQIFLDENEDSYCVWRVEYDEDERICYYGIDLFRRKGEVWQHSFEEHREYAYEVDELLTWLREAGFSRTEIFGDCRWQKPTAQEQRIYFAAYKE